MPSGLTLIGGLCNDCISYTSTSLLTWFSKRESCVVTYISSANYSIGQGKPSRSKDSRQALGSEQLVASIGGGVDWVENWSNCKPLKGVVRPTIFLCILCS